MENIEVSAEEKAALVDALGYLERKATKSAYWAKRMEPLAGLIGRLKGDKEEQKP
jgi:hypothetical protein